MTSILNVVEPMNYNEANQYDEWMSVMKEEYESITKNKTWELVELPEGKEPIDCKWLYKPKFKADGSVDKYKARLVAKGYSQKEGADYEETFSPVAKLNIVRMLIALATKHPWSLHQLDVRSAFLNGELKEEVFEMKDLGELHYCLGLEVWRDYGLTFLTQGKYVRGLLKKFRMDQCKAALVTIQQNVKLHNDDGSKEVDATLYRQLVGSLIYLTTTRLDLSFSVSVLSQLMSKPLENIWVAAKGVLRYVQGTINIGIKYIYLFDVKLIGYSDLDWAGYLDDRRYITGYAFNIGSGVISWSSKKQSIVSSSLAEAEYQVVCVTTCEAIWLRILLHDAGEEKKYATMIKCDNQSSIKLANNPVFHKNTKHIGKRFSQKKFLSNIVTPMKM
eukprot:PITA_21917